MVLVKIKPLSVNDAWKGRRFKSVDYIRYERDVLFLLPKMEVPNGKLRVVLFLYLSNKMSDIDNPVKPFLDILQKKYGFNDARIYELTIVKNIVEAGSESIGFSINSIG